MEHISYSQFNAYTQCPRSWYLGKIRQAEEKQTWYIPIGSAVHAMVEAYLDPIAGSTLVTSSSAEHFFYPLISRQLAIEPDTSKWLAGGSKSDPCVEGKALQRVKDCFDRALEFLDEIDVWEVEYDATGSLPRLEVPVKAFVDIIGEHKKHGPVILDWKTGSSKPKNAFQLETYAALLKSAAVDTFGSHDLPRTGLWAMLKPGSSVARPIDLSKVDPVAVGMKYQRVYDQMRQRLYPTNQGFTCKFCFHQDSCLVNAGRTPQALYYDHSSDDGMPY